MYNYWVSPNALTTIYLLLLTFFVLLFKQEALTMAWEFLVDVLHVPKENLFVTYFHGDDQLGLPADIDCKTAWLSLGYVDQNLSVCMIYLPIKHIVNCNSTCSRWQ